MPSNKNRSKKERRKRQEKREQERGLKVSSSDQSDRPCLRRRVKKEVYSSVRRQRQIRRKFTKLIEDGWDYFKFEKDQLRRMLQAEFFLAINQLYNLYAEFNKPIPSSFNDNLELFNKVIVRKECFIKINIDKLIK